MESGSTKSNFPNVLSREARADILIRGRVWFEGPEFLANHPKLWPSRFKIHELAFREVKVFNKDRVSAIVVMSKDRSPMDHLIHNFFYDSN